MARTSQNVHSPRPVLIASFVGGGPMERLTRYLPGARVVCAAKPERWRRWMSRGRYSRLAARAMAHLVFPAQAIWESARMPRAVFVPTTNPFLLPLIAVALRPLHRRAVVPLVYDLYPDALEATGLVREQGVASRVGKMLNRYWFARANGLVFIGARMAEHAMSRYGTPRRWTVIETGADARELRLIPSEGRDPQGELERWCQKKIIISYVGNLGLVHDWETIAAAIPPLVDAHPDVGVVIAASGPGVQRLREAWGNARPNVRFVPPLDDEPWRRLLQRSAISLVSLGEGAAHTSIPSKTFSAMAAGSAVVAIAPEGSDLADLIQRHEVGRRIDPGDTPGLTATLTELVESPAALANLRARARRVAETHYHLEALAQRWETFLAECARDWPGRSPTLPALAKRGFDVGVSAGLLLTVAPVMGLTALLVRVNLGSPVLFAQPRPGLHGKPFTLLKFRTMRAPRPGEEGPEHDGARLTTLGRWLRKTSLDELPTLINVFKGDMSLVGPRPLLMRYLERYTPEQARRHEVRPGITGWAQINGRNALSWNEKLALDVWYVDNQSLLLDLKILVRTFFKVLRADDISQAGHATMPEFMGDES